VLIVGAGVGNDVAAALAAGAASVVAVEIDRAIYRIGFSLHPAQPYRDPRVRVAIDDARHYMKTSQRSFDTIVFSHLDSHTLLSSFTTVRLDNYIYTVEAFGEARRRLAPGGRLFVSYWSEKPYIAERLYRNLTMAFGHPPVPLEGATAEEQQTQNWRNACFVSGEPDVMPALEAVISTWPEFRRVSYGASVAPSTDSWPFLPLERHEIPSVMLLISAVILVLSVGFAWWARPKGEAFDGTVFWLGAAFMLVEVHNVSRLALVFGTTWQVNAWTIGAILGMILLATFVSLRFAGSPHLRRIGALGLFATLAAAYLLPLDSVSAVVAMLVMAAPLFFAGLVFADAFAHSPAPAFALGWNTLGAVTGGMAENLSYVFGIPALVPIAAVFYALALAWPRPR
jgi:SAM-dependent methyltransferase